MKLDTSQLRAIMPVSMHTIMRYPDDPTFPKVEKIGRQSYFNDSAIYRWLTTRSQPANKIQHGDKLITIDELCRLVGRSKAWVWLNVVKPQRLTTVDLSPTGKSENPRNYFILREVLEELAPLVEIAGNAPVSERAA